MKFITDEYCPVIPARCVDEQGGGGREREVGGGLIWERERDRDREREERERGEKEKRGRKRPTLCFKVF
jgi:hypothetical protein